MEFTESLIFEIPFEEEKNVHGGLGRKLTKNTRSNAGIFIRND